MPATPATAKRVKQFRAEANCSAEWPSPVVATYLMDEAVAREIVELSGIVRAHDLLKIEKQHARVEYHLLDPGEDYPMLSGVPRSREPLKIECPTLNVSDTEFWVAARMKNHPAELWTEAMPVSELAEEFGIDYLPVKDQEMESLPSAIR